MPVSRARRKANDKWDAENMAHLATKVRREYADAVREIARTNGDTVNAILRRALDQYLMQNGVDPASIQAKAADTAG